jgi:U3 small nucleolar RNA-associated protein 7
MRQRDIAAAVDVGVARKAVDLELDHYGPYRCAYSRNGRYMLLAGEKGHVATVDWNRFAVTSEFHVKDLVRDVTFLHNASLFALAQSQYAYIYDSKGTEIHVLRNHIQPLALDFLPYHFLLVSTGNAGFLKYQDVSTGALVAEHRTKLGACSVLRHNPWNGVSCLGHSGGLVTMWTPNMSTPVVRQFWIMLLLTISSCLWVRRFACSLIVAQLQRSLWTRAAVIL